jgi:hypothetical protein
MLRRPSSPFPENLPYLGTHVATFHGQTHDHCDVLICCNASILCSTDQLCQDVDVLCRASVFVPEGAHISDLFVASLKERFATDDALG